jgi:hypothetical protein
VLALEKPKDMVVARPRQDGVRVDAKAAVRDALNKYPRTMAHLAR